MARHVPTKSLEPMMRERCSRDACSSAPGEQQLHALRQVHLWGGVLTAPLAQLTVARATLDELEQVAGYRPCKGQPSALPRRQALA